MSSNNAVYVMDYQGYWHVWHCLCVDNPVTMPDFNNDWYKKFHNRADALIYAHDTVKDIANSTIEEYGFKINVEYGVWEI